MFALTLHVEALDAYLANSRTADPYCWLLYHCYANENDIRPFQRIYQHLSVTSCEAFERIEFSLQSRLLKTFELMSPRLHNFAFIIDDAQELFSINPYYLSDNGQIRYAFTPVMSPIKASTPSSGNASLLLEPKSSLKISQLWHPKLKNLNAAIPLSLTLTRLKVA